MQQTSGLLRAIPEPLFSLDGTGRPLESNRAFDDLGLRPREVAAAVERLELGVGQASYRVEVLSEEGGVTYYRLARDGESSGRARALVAYLECLERGQPPLEAALEALWQGIGWRWTFVTRYNPRMMRQVQVLHCSEYGEPREPFDYAVRGTPCERVFGDDDVGCRLFTDLRNSFPDDPWIRRVGAQEYAGQIYAARRDVPLGHLFAISDEPREDGENAVEVVGLLGHLVSSELKALSWGALVDQATRHANQDALTGVASRFAWEQALEYLEGPQECRAGELGVAWLDLDRFKSVNDTLGHQEGDRLLVTFAHHLSSELRRTDSLFRIGGDEFALLLPDGYDSDWLDERVGRVTEVLAEHGFDSASVSFGGATVAEAQGRLREAIRLADARMYEMKRRREARRSG